MKILFLTSNMEPSGSNRNVLSLARRLRDLDYSIEIKIVDKSRLPVPWVKTYGLPIDMFGDTVASDVTCICSGYKAIGVFTGLYPKRHYFAYLQGFEPLSFAENTDDRATVEATFADSSRMIPVAITPVLAGWFAARYKYRHIVIIPTSIETGDFYTEPWFPKADRKRIIITGQYSEASRRTRDVDYVAFRASRDLGLEIFHVSTENSIFSMLADAYWIGPRTEWLRRIFSSCDIAVNATVYDVQSTLDLEYLACGIPIVRAISPGVPVTPLVDGVNALITDYTDVEAMRANILRLAGDDNLARKLSYNGYASIRAMKNWDEIALEWDRILRSYS